MIKSNTLLITFGALVTFFGPVSHSYAGPSSSGGGKGVVCRTPSGKIQSVELLDLWESRVVYKQKLQPFKGSVLQIVDKTLRSLSQSMRTDDLQYTYAGKTYSGPEALFWSLRLQADQFFQTPGTPQASTLRRLRNVQLTLTNDSYEPVLPSRCKIEQIVNYMDEDEIGGTILLNQDLVDHMNPVQLAALIVHEALYKNLRSSYGETASLRVRRAIGLAFSGHKFGSLNEVNLPSQYYVCSFYADENRDPIDAAGSSRIYFLPTNETGPTGLKIVIVQASMLGGLPLIDQAPAINEPPRRGYGVEDFSDLSSLTKNLAQLGLSLGSVQPELIPIVRIDEAGPGGRLKVSIAAKPSTFLSKGLDWQQAECEFRQKK